MALNKLKELIRYIFKGIFVGFVVILIYSGIMYSIIETKGIDVNEPFFNSLPMLFLIGQYFPSSFTFCLILYSLIGGLIGFIVGLIKTKNKFSSHSVFLEE